MPKTDDNDLEMFKKHIRFYVITDNFANRPETLAVKDDLIAARENGDDKALNKIIDSLYVTFGNEITVRKLEEKSYEKTSPARLSKEILTSLFVNILSNQRK